MEKKEKISLFKLFETFFRIGMFTFGGGLAMLPLLRREVVENHGWATEEELIDYYSIGQMTPGIIAVNVSTIIGYRERGIAGAFVAVFSFLTPAFVIIAFMASVIFKYSNLPVVKHAFSGIRIAVCALIANTVIRMTKLGVVDKLTFFVFAISFYLIAFVSLSPVIVISLAALTGWISKRVKI